MTHRSRMKCENYNKKKTIMKKNVEKIRETNQFIHEVKWDRTNKITLINGRILWLTIYERKRRKTKPKLQLN